MARFTCNFISHILKRAVDITVVIPSVTIPEAMMMEREGDRRRAVHCKEHKYPVLYLLHGMGNNHATWTGYSNVEMYAEEQNIAVVMISGENKSYVNHSSGDRFFDFIQEELPDFICGMFPVSDKKEDTYLAGLSMGGYGALVHGLSHPEKYGAVGGFSVPVNLNPCDASGGLCEPVRPEYSPRLLAEKRLEKKEKFPVLFLSCGEEDPFYEECRDFAEYLAGQGISLTWISVPGYGHEWRFWNEIVETFMDFLPRTDYYVQGKKRRI